MKPIVSTNGVECMPADRASNATATLTLAFASDPVNRWLWSYGHEFLRSFPQFVHGLGGRAFERSAFETAGGRGIALWLPPGVEPDEHALGALVGENVASNKQGVMGEIFEQMTRFHPRYAHWYLPFVGVDPLMQGIGLGAALLQPVLDHCDDEGLPAYLESTNARNIPFYERLGFRRVGVIQIGPCPAIVPMLREPAV